jgi:hypothetical protein
VHGESAPPAGVSEATTTTREQVVDTDRIHQAAVPVVVARASTAVRMVTCRVNVRIRSQVEADVVAVAVVVVVVLTAAKRGIWCASVRNREATRIVVDAVVEVVVVVVEIVITAERTAICRANALSHRRTADAEVVVAAVVLVLVDTTVAAGEMRVGVRVTQVVVVVVVRVIRGMPATTIGIKSVDMVAWPVVQTITEVNKQIMGQTRNKLITVIWAHYALTQHPYESIRNAEYFVYTSYMNV